MNQQGFWKNGRLAENEVEKARENRAEEMERTGEMEEAPEFFTTDEIIKVSEQISV